MFGIFIKLDICLQREWDAAKGRHFACFYLHIKELRFPLVSEFIFQIKVNPVLIFQIRLFILDFVLSFVFILVFGLGMHDFESKWGNIQLPRIIDCEMVLAEDGQHLFVILSNINNVVIQKYKYGSWGLSQEGWNRREYILKILGMREWIKN